MKKTMIIGLIALSFVFVACSKKDKTPAPNLGYRYGQVCDPNFMTAQDYQNCLNNNNNNNNNIGNGTGIFGLALHNWYSSRLNVQNENVYEDILRQRLIYWPMGQFAHCDSTYFPPGKCKYWSNKIGIELHTNDLADNATMTVKLIAYPEQDGSFLFDMTNSQPQFLDFMLNGPVQKSGSTIVFSQNQITVIIDQASLETGTMQVRIVHNGVTLASGLVDYYGNNGDIY